MIIGEDINKNTISLGQRIKRDDGVIGSFELRAFELVFRYEKIQENGAVCSYINHGYNYTIL